MRLRIEKSARIGDARRAAVAKGLLPRDDGDIAIEGFVRDDD